MLIIVKITILWKKKFYELSFEPREYQNCWGFYAKKLLPDKDIKEILEKYRTEKTKNSLKPTSAETLKPNYKNPSL